MPKKTMRDISIILDQKFRELKEDLHRDLRRDLHKDLREDLEQDMIRIFNQGVEEVVLPMVEDLATKDDIKNLATKDDVGKIRDRLDQIDRKLDVVTGKVFDHDHKIKELARRTVISQ